MHNSTPVRFVLPDCKQRLLMQYVSCTPCTGLQMCCLFKPVLPGCGPSLLRQLPNWAFSSAYRPALSTVCLLNTAEHCRSVEIHTWAAWQQTFTWVAVSAVALLVTLTLACSTCGHICFSESALLQAMTAGAAAQLDPPVVLSTMKSFLAAARPASPSAASPQGMSPVVACIAQLADSIACHSSACRGLAVLADVRAQAQQFAALAAAAELAQVKGGRCSGVLLEVLNVVPCRAMCTVGRTCGVGVGCRAGIGEQRLICIMCREMAVLAEIKYGGAAAYGLSVGNKGC